MASSSRPVCSSSLEQLIEEINFQRTKEMQQLLKDDSGFVMLHGTAYWTDLFVRHFLFEDDRNAQESDDLLFFIRKRHLQESRKHIPRYETLLEVFRRDSKKLPIGDPEIDWEETIYANLIIHNFDYYVTLAVCTRTSPKELQVLKRHTERVWASPSRRLMSDKGTSEEITYPNICFMLDNFDEAFTDIVVRDGEMVSVELVARDRGGSFQSVIFLGSVRYDALKRVYDARSSLSSKMAQRMTFGLFASPDAQRMEFVRVKGPMGKGHAELAVTRPPGVGCETPGSEPGVPLTERSWDADREPSQEPKQQRRMSEPSNNVTGFVNANFRLKPRDSPGIGSENDALNVLEESVSEIEAGDIQDDGESRRGPARVDSAGAEETRGGDVQVGAAASARTAPGRTGPGAGDDTGRTSGREGGASRSPSPAEEARQGPACAAEVGGEGAREGVADAQTPGDGEEPGRARAIAAVETRADQAGAPEHAERPAGDDEADGGRTPDAPSSAVEPAVCAAAGAAGLRSDGAAAAGAPRGRPSSLGPGRRASGGALAGRRPAPLTPGQLYRQACGQLPAAAARCPCARTPDGTVVHYRCHVQQRFLRDRELDDGVCNPIWTMRGFSQTFHFWKETKRASSLPLNAFLTYVMLPWHAIINDIITKDDRRDPILSF